MANPLQDRIPPATFRNFITELAATALVCLGFINNPMTGTKSKDLPRAKHLIDLLGILADKTRGNLDAQEDDYLRAVVTDLRVKYLELAGPAEPGPSSPESPSSEDSPEPNRAS